MTELGQNPFFDSWADKLLKNLKNSAIGAHYLGQEAEIANLNTFLAKVEAELLPYLRSNSFGLLHAILYAYVAPLADRLNNEPIKAYL